MADEVLQFPTSAGEWVNRRDVSQPAQCPTGVRESESNARSPGVFAINCPPGWSSAAAAAKCVWHEAFEVSLGWKWNGEEGIDDCLANETI